jgi:hypothetical protein
LASAAKAGKLDKPSAPKATLTRKRMEDMETGPERQE